MRIGKPPIFARCVRRRYAPRTDSRREEVVEALFRFSCSALGPRPCIAVAIVFSWAGSGENVYDRYEGIDAVDDRLREGYPLSQRLDKEFGYNPHRTPAGPFSTGFKMSDIFPSHLRHSEGKMLRNGRFPTANLLRLICMTP